MPRPSSATTRPASPKAKPERHDVRVALTDPPQYIDEDGPHPVGPITDNGQAPKPAPEQPKEPAPAGVSAEVATLIIVVRAGRAAAPRIDAALKRLTGARDAHERAIAARKAEVDAAATEWDGLRRAAASAAGAEVQLIRLAPADLAEAYNAAYQAESAAHGDLTRTKLELDRARKSAEPVLEQAASAKEAMSRLRGVHKKSDHKDIQQLESVIDAGRAAGERVADLMKRVRTLERDLKARTEELAAAASRAIRAATNGAITTASPPRTRS